MAIKAAFLVVNMFLPGIYGGILCVAMRLCLHFFLLIAGIRLNKFFPGKARVDANMVQILLDTLLVLANSFALAYVTSLPIMATMLVMTILTLSVVTWMLRTKHGGAWVAATEEAGELLLHADA